MKLQDKWTLGYLQVREHDTSIKPEDKNIQMLRTTQQEDNTRYTGISEFGDWQGMFYWDFVPLSSVPPIISVQDSSDAPPARKKKILPFADGSLSANTNDRNVGSWANITPAVKLPEGFAPIFSKTQGIDARYKTIPVADIQVATGTNIPDGFPTLVVQCLNSESYELMSFPIGNFLATDNDNTGLSTKVGRVKEGKLENDGEVASLGSIMLAIKDENSKKVVALQTSSQEDLGLGGAILVPDATGGVHLCYLDSNKGGVFVAGANTPGEVIGAGNEDYISAQNLGITAQARYHKDDFRDGKLAFSDTLFPVLTGDEEVVEVLLGFDSTTKTWRWFVNSEGSATLIARIAWNMQDVDLSEGELLGAGTEIEPKIWIDYEKSKRVEFRTFGSDTLFRVVRITTGINRNGETRDLYRVVQVEEESPNKINLVEIRNRDTRSYSVVLGNTPFIEPEPRILTLIGAELKENIIRVNLPTQWDIDNLNADFKYLELSSDRPVLDSLYAPIRPSPKDQDFATSGLMNSLVLFNAETPIATYAINLGVNGIDGQIDSVTTGANLVPVFGDPKRSTVLRNLDQEDTKICRILSYTNSSGVAEVENLWETSHKFLVKCLVNGTNIRPPDQDVNIGGIITIHRTPTIEAPTGWTALFPLPNSGEAKDILVVGANPLVQDQDGNFRVSIITGLNVFSSGGAQVTQESPEISIHADIGIVPVAFLDEKSDCETVTGRGLYYITVQDNEFIGDVQFSLLSTCCDEPEPDPDPDPDPQITSVVVRGFNINGVLQFSHGFNLLVDPLIVPIGGGNTKEVFTAPTTHLGSPVEIAFFPSNGRTQYRATDGQFAFTSAGALDGVIASYVGQVFSTSVNNAFRNTRIVIVSAE